MLMNAVSLEVFPEEPLTLRLIYKVMEVLDVREEKNKANQI